MEQRTAFAGAYLPLHFQLRIVWERLLSRPIDSVIANFYAEGGTPKLAEAMLEEAAAETGHRVPPATFKMNPTIAGLAKKVLSHADCETVAELQRGDGEAPFFFLHGDILGGGFYARRLAEQIGTERPFYAVPLPSLRRESRSTIEKVAAQYCASLREHRPRGPYVLGGFSLAALCAYEMARQLSLEGEEVQAVILIDPDLPTALERLCLRTIDARNPTGNFGEKVDSFTLVYNKLARLRYVWKSPLHEKARFVLRNGAKLLKRPSHPSRSASGPVPADGIDCGRVELFQWLATAYALKPYAGTVTLMLTESQIKARPTLVRRWSRAVAQLRVHRLPGSHMTVITEYRATLAAKINDELQTAHSVLMGFLSALAPVVMAWL